MRKEDLNQTDDIFITQKLEEAFGYSDEQLLEEFERAAAQAAEHPDPRLTPPEGEFQKIMARVEEDKKAEKKVLRLKKMMKPLLVAAVLGTVVLGTGIGVSGKREFEYWVREKDGGEEVVFNNAESIEKCNNIEEAYKKIEEDLGIQVVEFLYLPDGTVFNSLSLDKNRARVELLYDNHYIHYCLVLKGVENSEGYISDRESYKEVYNRYLDMDILMYKNKLSSGEVEYGAQWVDGKAYYTIEGIVDEEEFTNILEKLNYYE